MNLLFETHNHLAFVTLNRPEKLNALSREMLEELREIFERIAQDENLRCVILTGAGDKAFCAGTDISETILTLIENSSVPVIAAINGIAAGGGCELVLACHLRIASQTSEFSLPETRLGLIANKKINAEEALRIGLVNRVVPSSDVLEEATSIAQTISSLAPLAVRACLQAVIRGFDLPLEEGLELEAKLFSSLFATQDMREGTSAFWKNVNPIFKANNFVRCPLSVVSCYLLFKLYVSIRFE
jgi:enoyl-CoA hydratase